MYRLVYMYTYSRVTSICIDLSKIKLFVFVYAYGCSQLQNTTTIVQLRCYHIQ